MSIPTKLAYHIDTKKIIHVDQAGNGLACGCECIKCEERLEAIQGEIRDWHFRHHKNKECTGSQETALHQLGKQILIDNNEILIPEIGPITYTNPVAEKGFYSTRPDVTAVYNGHNMYFEIAVTHFVEKNKETFFKNGSYKCIEIDLSTTNVDSFEEVKRLVLIETSNKKTWGFEIQKTTDTKSWNYGKLLLIAGIFIGLWYFIFGRRNDK
jgi:competence protein CoiA